MSHVERKLRHESFHRQAPAARAERYREEAADGGRRILPFLTLVYVFLLLYGSLYSSGDWRAPYGTPFDFLSTPWPRDVSRADVLVNVLVYMPLGLFIMLWAGARSPVAGFVLAVVTGGLISFGVEAIQSFTPGRTQSSLDLLTNIGGTAAGAALAGLVRHHIGRSERLVALRARWFLPGEAATAGLLAIGVWALSQLSPLVPSIDVANLRHGLAPLWHWHLGKTELRPFAAAAYALNLTGLGLFAASMSQRGRRVGMLFAAFAACVVLLKVPVVGRQLSPESAMGILVAIPAVALLQAANRRALVALAALLIIAGYTFSELEPGRGPTHPFNWIPFLGQVTNNLDGFANILATLWPFAVLGCIASFVTPYYQRAGAAVFGGMAAAAFAFGTEWLQQDIPGRYGDVTVPLLALGGWTLAWFWRPSPEMRAAFAARAR